jgi:hypothetical protein
MRIQYNRGYYICGMGSGGAHGPKAKELSKKWHSRCKDGFCHSFGAASLTASLVYGNPVVGEFEPWDTVRPIERAYELLRYFDPEEQNFIYITRFEPERIIWGADENATPVPATPELNAVFDEYLPRWEHERKLYYRRNRRAFMKGMKRAGLTLEDVPKWHGDDASENAKAAYDNAYKIFYQNVAAHIRPPKPLLVEVLGIDDVLEGIEITQLPERFLKNHK